LHCISARANSAVRSHNRLTQPQPLTTANNHLFHGYEANSEQHFLVLLWVYLSRL